MSILGSIYKSMTGLLGFTQALDNLSNNIANMNTPGFKGRDLYFRELSSSGSNFNSQGTGFGVYIDGSSVRFTQGDINSTGNQTDMAIDGNGFFVLRNGFDELYTKAGQFRFDDAGYLVDPSSGRRVAALGESGVLSDINLDSLQLSKGNMTTLISLSGNLNASSGIGTVFPPAGTLVSIDIIDTQGISRSSNMSFTRLAGNQWEVRVLDDQKNVISEPYTIGFDGEGNLISAFRYFSFLYNPKEISVEDRDYLNVDIQKQALFPAGNSTFSLPQQNELSYVVRDGEVSSLSDGTNFRFDADGYLVNENGLRLAVADENGLLSDVSIKDELSIPAVATTKVVVSGNLNRSLANSSVVPNIIGGNLPFTFNARDAEGVNHSFTMSWAKVVNDEWLLDISDENGVVIVNDKVINFNVNGFVDASDRLVSVNYPVTGTGNLMFTIDLGAQTESTAFKQVSSVANSFNVESVNGTAKILATDFSVENGVIKIYYEDGSDTKTDRIALGENILETSQEVTLDFNSSKGITSTATASKIEMSANDGLAPGSLVSFGFDKTGMLQVTFSNGEVEDVAQLALANFSSLNSLVPVGDTYFRLPEGIEIAYGHAGSESFGELRANSLEMSNIDLSKEFADIIIVQRGYQASSQVLNVSNELIQELYDSTKGK